MSEPNTVIPARNRGHVADALGRLSGQFANATRLRGLVTALATETQALEDAAWDVLEATLAAATGDALDQVGAVLGLPRGTTSDDEVYRAALRATARARRSSGPATDLVAVAALLFGESPSDPPTPLAFSYREGGASVTIEPHEVPAVSAAVAITVLRVAKDVGVRLCLFDPPAVEANLFAFSDDPLRPGLVAANGFSDTTMLNGGQLTGAVV